VWTIGYQGAACATPACGNWKTGPRQLLALGPAVEI
jgi:hypothetical protein